MPTAREASRAIDSRGAQRSIAQIVLIKARVKQDDTEAAHARMYGFRCLLNRRGVAAAPVDNADARTSPPGPGGCFEQ